MPNESDIPRIGPPLGDLHEDLNALGSGSTTYNFNSPDTNVLERFPNPSFVRMRNGSDVSGVLSAIDITAPEFTSLCPKTGQPDYAKIVIKYTPNEWCVESKSLKLFLNGFRNFGCFHEQIVDMIGVALAELLDPHVLHVQGQFTPRGGIPFWPLFQYQRKSNIVSV